MPLTKLVYKPGINKESTSYSTEGGWYDCDKVRFRMGYPEKIGGWVKHSEFTYQGSAVDIKPFIALDGTYFNGVGTNLKYYIDEGGVYNDITPIRSTTAAGDVTFTATNGSSIIVVDDVGHGALEEDFVTFSDAVSLGGNITADVLNQEYQIAAIIDDDSYEIVAKDTSGSEVTADASDTGNGGSNTVGAYQINTGLATSVVGTGWGAGAWSRGAWGSAASLLVQGRILRLWSSDTFGEDLIINPRNGGIYYWDKSADYTNWDRAVAISDLPGADATTPTVAKQIMVSDNSRHVIAFGCDPLDDIGTQDPLLIRFSEQEDVTTWLPTALNTAGDVRIGSGSEIICAVETRQQILIFTEISLHVMQYLGPPFTFGIEQISGTINIMSPNCAISIDDRVFWMGLEDFYMYNGQVNKIPCTVRSYVFDDFNDYQAEKVFAALNSAFGEITWFYPSSNTDQIDRYVTYNYMDNVWTVGTMGRTAWVDRGVNQNPLAAAADGYLYEHEVGQDDNSTVPASPVEAYIESSQIDIGEGDQYAFISRLIPDVTFTNSDSSAPSLNFIVKMRNFPGGNYLTSENSVITRSATVPVEQYTQQAHIRLRGRSFAVRLESDQLGVQWRLGHPRLDIRTDGRR